ncbi:hypothetical protein LCGC14_0666060 [marine sediment metagenome]|uniref:Uncharacterized protein n=1 Tax=marine sediment metagenome TaxID=412755 RepID=A0A0F9QXD0_9ZZZZ
MSRTQCFHNLYFLQQGLKHEYYPIITQLNFLRLPDAKSPKTKL